MSVAESEKVWVVHFGGETYGPVSAVEIKQGLLDQTIRSDDGLWKKGWSGWKRFQDIPLFAFQCKQSPGQDRPSPELPVPSAEDFQSVLTPQMTSKDVSTTVNWSKKRLAIVGASYMVAGPIGAVAAGVITRTGKKQREATETKDDSHVSDRNR